MNTPELADVEAPAGGVGWRALPALLVRPATFFADLQRATRWPLVLWLAFAVGIAATGDAIERQMLKATLGRLGPGGVAAMRNITDSWVRTWIVLVCIAPLWAVTVWYLGGWWYGVRLRLAGATRSPAPLVRAANICVGAVQALPVVLIWCLRTVVYPSQSVAWVKPALWNVVPLVMPFVACWTSYKAALSFEGVSRGDARVWFVILPALWAAVLTWWRFA